MSIINKRFIAVIMMILLISVAFAGCAPKVEAPAVTPTEPTTPATPTNSLRPEGVPADFPTKEIEWIYAFSAGSPMDAYFRMLADKVQEMEGWKTGFIVTYKEGASGKIGWNAVAEAKPDGYTLGFNPSALLISSIADKVSYGYDKMSYIMNTMTDPGAIGVVSSSKYKTLTDVVNDAKARPGEVSFAVTSTIGQEGLTLKLIEKAAGVDLKVIAFDGEAEAVAAVLGGHVDAFCLNITDVITYVEDGQINVIATGDKERSKFLPDVATYIESGYDVMQVNMRAIGGPKGIPEPIRQYLENVFMAAAADPEVMAKVAEMKIPVDTLSGADTEAKFTDIALKLQKLWETEPWQ